MEKWRGKVAVVTGASSGIGAATARALASHGMRVLALARREDRLQELADEVARDGVTGKIYPMKTDLRKEEEILAAFSWADSELGGADVLVNNAGLYVSNYHVDAKTEDWQEVLDVNVLAVSIATREYLKSMERRNNQTGHIFVINRRGGDSIAGHVAELPMLSMYVGSKHCVTAITKCLRRELAQRNSTIKVTSVSPGGTLTEIFKAEGNVAALKELPLLQADDVAKVVVDALSSSPTCQICEVVLTPVPTKVAFY